MRSGDGWRRYVAPAAFLLAVTIAVVLVRAGLEGGGSNPVTQTTTAPAPTKRFWTVRAGDTLAVIAKKTGVPAVRLRKLNPKARATLFIGERIRLR